jgi:hypothetical protein
MFIYSFTTLKPVLFLCVELNDFNCLAFKKFILYFPPAIKKRLFAFQSIDATVPGILKPCILDINVFINKVYKWTNTKNIKSKL